LPALVLMRLDDALLVGSDQREFGSQVLVGVRASASGNAYRYDPGGRWQRSGSWGAATSVQYLFARPIGLRWTTAAAASYSLALPAATLVHTLRGNLGAAYDIADRLQAQAEIDLGADISGQKTGGAKWDAGGSFSSGLSYYLTDALRITVSTGANCRNKEPDAGSGQPSVTFNFKFGITAGPQWSFIPDLSAGQP